MKKMTSRERVMTALQHKEPDKIPIDFGSTRSTGINALAYRNLIEYLGIEEEVKVFDFKQLLAQPGNDVLELFESDCVPLYRLAPSGGIAIDKYKKETLMDGKEYLLPADFSPVICEDGSAVIMKGGIPVLKRPAEGLYFDDCYHPLEEAEDELGEFELPEFSSKELDMLERRAKELYYNTDKAIVASTGISIFEKGIKDWGYEEFLVRIYTEPEIIKKYLDRLTEKYLGFLDQYLERVGNYVQIFQCNDDLGMQTSTLIAPDIYEEVFKPYHTQIFSCIKKKIPGSFVMLHCCGSIYDMIPHLIDAGVDILNPVQINAHKMDPENLKKEFGTDITFWGGGCSTQTTLPFGTLAEVEEETRRMIQIFAPGGGFVFNQVHNIQNNVKPDHIVKLYDVIKKNREYKNWNG